MSSNKARIGFALGRMSLVVFLIVALSYQSWYITAPLSTNDFNFTTVPRAKLIPSLFDIDDEHRSAHASLSSVPAAQLLMSSPILAAQIRGRFPSELQFNSSTLHRTTVVLLI